MLQFSYVIKIIITFFLSLFSISHPQSALQIPTPTPTPTIYISPSPTLIPKPKIKPTTIGDTSPWGVSQQIGDVTWTMKIAPDSHMGTPQEILLALNDYRIRFGSQPLTRNDNLASYAQSRADYLASIKTTDSHTGFNDYLNNQDGFNKLGFTWLGENISYGFHLEAVHLIEWMYAGDQPHNENQLNNRWNYVGIGVNGTATALIFGTGKK